MSKKTSDIPILYVSADGIGTETIELRFALKTNKGSVYFLAHFSVKIINVEKGIGYAFEYGSG